ncbi:hypothetical protein [Jeotgalibaca caeni]|uniref:hypothetical protein n=1 Tax=Jeotgalibaca caeni TaxID=3028623 RepID=UPI00237E0A3F|nr:hypothetical protein [Jeotgalibaca caeni]MDE1548818.1 hypothetical protein [Jeotgalibaca caeni]
MIDRIKLLKRNNPVHKVIDYQSPLTIGNGEFAFTADITGLQSFPEIYATKGGIPLCTMSQWGWHSTPVDDEGNTYDLTDLEMTDYQMGNKKVVYPVEPQAGNEEIYHWLRENPHRVNLSNLRFTLDEEDLVEEALSQPHQELDLYSGVLESNFHLDGQKCSVETMCDSVSDAVGIRVHSPLFSTNRLKLKLDFFYPSSDISGWDKESKASHETKLEEISPTTWQIMRKVDGFSYFVYVTAENAMNVEQEEHAIWLYPSNGQDLAVSFLYSMETSINNPSTTTQLKERCVKDWNDYWNTVGMIDFEQATDHRAAELERRLILSQYLTTIQGTGSMPPQETGLICNSWYGKFHLEMHLWHSAYFPLWNKPELLERTLKWYLKNKGKAEENAERNGFVGLRWPKMIGPDAVDSPSIIAPLLVWQQPHILYMLELVYQQKKDVALLTEYWEIVEGTAQFMCDFLKYDEKDDRYHLIAPLIPAQEEFDPTTVLDPTFELEYWRFGLLLAEKWAERLKKPTDKWEKVRKKIAVPVQKNGLYLSHANCSDTYENYNRDHPMMVGAYGLIPSEYIDPEMMTQTLEKVVECWEFETLWGWDFALMAMCATRLGKPELAVQLLLMDSPKNSYVKNGNNYQKLRNDLPVYLPGNGSLLLATALMVAGTTDSSTKLPGFPDNGKWEIQFEGIAPFPY